MLGIGLYDCSCGRPSSIRAVKRLGEEGAFWALRLVHCVEGVHSKQLIFRIRVLLEYGHHTRVRGEDRKGREQPLSAVSQAGQALSESVRALRYLEMHTVQRVSQSGYGPRSKSSNIGSVVQYRRALAWPSSCEQNWKELDVTLDGASVSCS